MEAIKLSSIIIPTRLRKDYGDIPELAASIKEYGLIQPILLTHDGELVAGGRRLAAMKSLGLEELLHAKHFVIREDDRSSPEGRLRLAGVELEENIRRKDMSWYEQVEAKQRLLELMQSIHGQAKVGPTSRSDAAQGTTGFGVNKLAAMLGESTGAVSQDLQLASMLKAMPQLKQQDSKSAARRIGTVQIALHAIKIQQAAKPPALAKLRDDPSGGAIGSPDSPAVPVEEAAPRWELHQGKNFDHSALVDDESVDLVYTDLPYGVDLDSIGVGASLTSSGHSGAISYEDKRETIINDLPMLAAEAYRVLRPARFGVFFFGFNYYGELLSALRAAGFSVNPVPVVWLKHSQSAINPLARYANGYEQALVAAKGAAKFIRPGQPNIVDVPGLRSAGRVQVAQQPVELVERFIQDMTLPGVGARVLDFYAGTGTTGVAAMKHGCFPILFERSLDQCLIIKSRLENTTIAKTATGK